VISLLRHCELKISFAYSSNNVEFINDIPKRQSP
jgi:hypothetical protein